VPAKETTTGSLVVVSRAGGRKGKGRRERRGGERKKREEGGRERQVGQGERALFRLLWGSRRLTFSFRDSSSRHFLPAPPRRAELTPLMRHIFRATCHSRVRRFSLSGQFQARSRSLLDRAWPSFGIFSTPRPRAPSGWPDTAYRYHLSCHLGLQQGIRRRIHACSGNEIHLKPDPETAQRRVLLSGRFWGRAPSPPFPLTTSSSADAGLPICCYLFGTARHAYQTSAADVATHLVLPVGRRRMLLLPMGSIRSCMLTPVWTSRCLC
jgi:hypothetical protein